MTREDNENVNDNIWIKFRNRIYAPDEFLAAFSNSNIPEGALEFVNAMSILNVGRSLLREVKDPVKYRYLEEKLNELERRIKNFRPGT